MVGLCVAASVFLVGCSERMEDDPEDLAVGIAQATYDRTFGTLELHAAPSLEDELLASPEEGFDSAVYWRLDDENLPEGNLQTEGVQPLPVPFVPAGLSFYDVPATEPGGRDVTVTVARRGNRRRRRLRILRRRRPAPRRRSLRRRPLRVRTR